MNTFRILFRALLLLAVQVFVCNQIHLFGYATPILVCALLLYFPQQAPRVGMLLWSFVLGLGVDIFSNTPGLCAGSLTFVAMLRPMLLDLQIPKDKDDSFVPTYRGMGFWRHVRFVFMLVFVHIAAYHLLDSFSFYHLGDFFLSFLLSLVLTFVLVLLMDSLRKE